MANEQRLINANDIVKVAEHAYNEWNLAMAAADGQRQINLVYKMKELCKAVKAVADAAPTVDAVEVVHARWKDGDCTACGFDIRDMIDGESEFRSWVWECVPYCPNCGAKMDGGNEDG